MHDDRPNLEALELYLDGQMIDRPHLLQAQRVLAARRRSS